MAKLGGVFGSGSPSPESEARRLKAEGNFLAAGKLLEDASRLSEAAEVYLAGKEYQAAAAVLDRLGRRDQAAELYLKTGDYKKAADALIKGGNPLKAAELLLEKGQSQEAAKLFGLAGAWDKAAELYVKAGYPLRAAQAYEKQGLLAKAAECYEQHFVENVSYGTTQTSAATADMKMALRAGQLFEQTGELGRALEIYARAGYFREAATAAKTLGQFPKAAELFTRAEDLQSAAEAWEQAGDSVRSSLLRGEVAFKDDRMAEAAACFREGQDYYRAAELFESLGLLAEAAECYQAGGSYGEAASAYLRADDKRGAAAAYEMGGQFETAAKLCEEVGDGVKAAQLFEQAGLTFKSGEAAARAGETQRAIGLLQRVEPSDENYGPAVELLARLFVDVGMPALAVERLQQAVSGQVVSAATLGLFYSLAVCNEAVQDAAGALAIHKRILAVDFSFRDVAERVRYLQAGGRPPLAASVRPAPGSDDVYEVVEETVEVAGTSEAPVTPAPPAPIPMPAAGPRFVPKEDVGQGPLGAVYRAEDQTDGRSVALRILPADALKPEILGGLVSDLVAAARLSHPNLVKVLGVVDFDAQSCVLSEFVRGSNLAESLRAGQRMSVQHCHSLGRTLAQVLSFIHARGMVHGSLRPSNIMVISSVVKLADLGLGRLFRAATPADCYRAPENRLDVPGDIFSLGAVLYHLLTGVEPKVRAQGPPMSRPSQLAPGVPERFDKFLLRCLDPNPEARFSAAEESVHSLEAMITIA